VEVHVNQDKVLLRVIHKFLRGQHVFTQRLARRAPVGAVKVHQDHLWSAFSLRLGFGELAATSSAPLTCQTAQQTSKLSAIFFINCVS